LQEANWGPKALPIEDDATDQALGRAEEYDSMSVAVIALFDAYPRRRRIGRTSEVDGSGLWCSQVTGPCIKWQIEAVLRCEGYRLDI
jgi:hypothetical protein